MEDENKDKINVCLIFSKFNGIINDLMKILFLYDDDLSEMLNSNDKKCIEEFELRYNEEIRNQLRCGYVKTVIFIATNDSVRSEKCIKLLELSRDLNIPIVSLIVEEIKNLDEIKSTVLSDIDHHYEVFKDRVHLTGYDQYMWLGECFQNFLGHIKNDSGIKKMKENLTSYHISYLLSGKKSPQNIGNIIKLLTNSSNVLSDYELNEKLNDTNTVIENSITEQVNKSNFDFNYYDYFLKRAEIEENVEYYASIIRIFNEIVLNADIFKYNDTKTGYGIGQPFFRDRYTFIYSYIQDILLGYYVETDEKMTSFLAQELKKHGIDIDLIENLFGLLYNNQNDIVYNAFLDSKTVMFLLTKDYYESKKFQKLYYEAKRMKKRIFLVKLELAFEITNDKEYSQIYVHDISKHENNAYEGYLTRKLKEDFNKCCGIDSNNGFEYSTWYEIFIYIDQSQKIERIQKLRKIFEENKERVRCKFDYIGNEDERNEINDDMEKSKIVLFCLTNDYLKTDKYRNEFNLVKKHDKRVLFLLMEEINSTHVIADINLSLFNVIEFYKIDSTTFKGEIFYRLCYFVYSLLDFKQNRVSYEDDERVQLQHFQSQNYSILRNSLPYKRDKLIKLIPIPRQNYLLQDVAYIKHLSSYCFLTERNCYFYDSNFSYTHEFIHAQEYTRKKYFAVMYDEKNKNMYLAYKICEWMQSSHCLIIEMLDDKMQFIKKIFIKVSVTMTKPQIILYDNQIFVIDLVNIRVYDLNLEFLVNIKSTKIDGKFHIESRCKNYAFIVNYKNREINIFNFNGFKFSENKFLDHDIVDFSSSKFTNNLIFEYKERENAIGVWKVECKNYENSFASNLCNYVCQLNSCPPHLLKHPYVLPCGSIACLECIYENYNLYLNKFICAACGNNEHQQLKNQMEKSTLIEDNLKIISELQLQHLETNKRNIGQNLIDKHEILENRVKFMEDEIEIRIESIKTVLDEHKLPQLEFIDRLERKLLKKISRSYETRKNRTSFNALDLFKLISDCPFKTYNNDKELIGSFDADS